LQLEILAPYFAQITLQVQKDVEFADVLVGAGLIGGLQGGSAATGASGAAAHSAATALFATSPSAFRRLWGGGGMGGGGGGFADPSGAACAACISGQHGPATHGSGGSPLRTSQVPHPMLARLGRGGGRGSMTSASPAGAMGMKRRVSSAANLRSGSPTNLGRRSPSAGSPAIDEGDAV
jgi:hypothetical protein